MTDAEATVKFAIFDAVSSNMHKNNAMIIRDEVFNKIFESHLRWAVKEYLEEIENQTP